MTLQQSVGVHATHYQDTHLTVDFERELAYLDRAPMKLTHKAYTLLAFLVRHPGELVPREALLESVWGYSPDIRTRTLDVHVRRLRRSLGSYGTIYIETIFGIGYRFQPCVPRSRQIGGTPLLAQKPAVEEPRQWKMAGSSAF